MHSIIQLYYNSFKGLSRPIWWLSFVTLINRSGAMVLPFLAVYLTQELQFTKGEAGLVITLFGVGSLIGSYLGGYLTDRIGYYGVMFWSLIIGGLLFVLLAYEHSFWAIGGHVLILSIITESFRPASMVAISTYSQPENTTRSFGLFRFAINLGFSLGPALGGLIAATAGYFWLFWVDGLTCIAAAFLFRWTLKEKSIAEQSKQKENTKRVPTSVVFKDRAYLFFLLISALSTIVFVQFTSVIPVFFKEEALLSEFYIGIILAMNGLLITLVEMPLVYKLEKVQQLLKIILVGFLFMGGCYLVLFSLPAGLWAGLLSIVFLTIGEMLCFPFGNTYAVQQSSPETKGRYMALYAASWSVAHIVAPTLGFQIAGRWSYQHLWVFLIILSLVSALGAYYLNLRQQNK